jgi:exodeoxyribonuclease VII large subunit
MLKPYFETATGRSLTSGLKVLVQVSVEYQEVFGLSFVIKDIDPTYTLGDLEQRKREVIQRLRSEGVFDMNKELELPEVLQRIAVISSPTAAGYGDFVNQLESNGHDIKFYHHLFPAIMQGDQSSESIAAAFDRIFEHAHFFDVVVIIRGGGASVDLVCFDDYWVAYNITQFPLPVLTGIGHERDQSIADMVAHTSLKTPTAVAEFILAKSISFLERINDHAQNLTAMVRGEMESQNQRLVHLVNGFGPLVKLLIQQKKHHLEITTRELPSGLNLVIQKQTSKINAFVGSLKQKQKQAIGGKKLSLTESQKHLIYLAHGMVKQQKQKLVYFEKSNKLNDPAEVLKRGYSLTYFNGKLIKDSNLLEVGNLIETKFRDGRISSTVANKN